MVRGEKLEFEIVDVKRLALFYRVINDRRVGPRLNLGEIRIDRPVKDVSLKYVDYFRHREYIYRLRKRGKDVVDKKRQAGDVIKVSMGQDHVPQVLSVEIGRRHRQRPCIDRNAIIDHQTR